jgi:hypothetical protein
MEVKLLQFRVQEAPKQQTYCKHYKHCSKQFSQSSQFDLNAHQTNPHVPSCG